MTTSVSHENAIPPSAGTQSDMSAWDLPDYISGTVLTSTATEFQIQMGQVIWTFTGQNFSYAGDVLTTGTLTGFTIEQNSVVYADVDGFSMDVATQFNPFLNANNTSGFEAAVFSGNDTITDAYHAIGYAGNDQIVNAVIAEGGAGNDVISVQGISTNYIDGGNDDDTVIFTGGTLMEDQVFGGLGTDLLRGTWTVATSFRADHAGFELVGNSVVYGSAIANGIDFRAAARDPGAFSSIDVYGGGGNDLIYGLSNGSSHLYGGDGNDHLDCGTGDDYLNGDAGDDFMVGGFGNDVIDDFSGNDWMRGAAGDDIITVNSGGDIAYGDEDNDQLTNLGSSATFYGGAGNDILRGSGVEVFYGGAQDDTIYVGNGDNAWGGSGGDLFVFAEGESPVSVIGEDGMDTIELAPLTAYTFTTALNGIEFLVTAGGSISFADQALAPGAVLTVSGGESDPLVFDGSAETKAGFVLLGTELNDLLTGGGGVDEFEGAGGADNIYGGGGNDQLDGGADNDYLRGGVGDDYIVGGLGNDVIEDFAGNDEVYGGAGQDVITVNDGGDTVYGGDDDDQLTSLGSTATLYGDAGNDTLQGNGAEMFYGGAQNDTIYAGAGDSAYGGTGTDVFVLTAGESPVRIVGDDGVDTIQLAPLASPFVFTSDLTSVEILLTAGGSISFADQALGAGESLTVEGGAASPLLFDGSAEANAAFILLGTDFDDVLTGGGGNDEFHAGMGADHIVGGGGNDAVYFTYDDLERPGTFDTGDTVDGGAGTDTLYLKGPYDGVDALVFTAGMMQNVEKVVLLAGSVGLSDPFIYDITLDDGNIARGGKLIFDCTDLRRNGPATIDASAETNGKLVFIGGESDDTYIGGAKRDIFQGGGAIDYMTGGGGADRFVYVDVTDSTSSDFDIITGFNASKDRLSFDFAVTGLDAAVNAGRLTEGTMDVDLAAALGPDHLGAHHAVLFTPNLGKLGGHVMLVVDANGVAGYQAGEDFVIELNGALHLEDLASAFIVS